MTMSKFYILLTFVVGVTTSVIVSSSLDRFSNSCDCELNSVEFNPALPISHPNNRCWLQSQASQQSWWAWLTGDSQTAEFHFIDLLELLSRSSTNPAMSTTEQQNSIN